MPQVFFVLSLKRKSFWAKVIAKGTTLDELLHSSNDATQTENWCYKTIQKILSS